MKIVGGCDAGGTKTVVRIQHLRDQQRVMATGQAVTGPGNVLVDQTVAVENIVKATKLALADADLPQETPINQFVAAVAGAGRKAQQDATKCAIEARHRVFQLDVVPDTNVLLQAAEVEYGIVLVCGTGSIVWARDRQGNVTRVGGFGPRLGDEGSGYWMGIQAVKATAQRLQHSLPPTPLMNSVLTFLQANNLAELVSTVYSWRTPHSHFAELAKTVTANLGVDELADDLVRQTAGELTTMMRQAYDASVDDGARDAVPWVCSGGLLLNCKSLRSQITSRCAEAGLRLTPPTLVGAPVEGALKIARRRCFNTTP